MINNKLKTTTPSLLILHFPTISNSTIDFLSLNFLLFLNAYNEFVAKELHQCLITKYLTKCLQHLTLSTLKLVENFKL